MATTPADAVQPSSNRRIRTRDCNGSCARNRNGTRRRHSRLRTWPEGRNGDWMQDRIRGRTGAGSRRPTPTDGRSAWWRSGRSYSVAVGSALSNGADQVADRDSTELGRERPHRRGRGVCPGPMARLGVMRGWAGCRSARGGRVRTLRQRIGALRLGERVGRSGRSRRLGGMDAIRSAVRFRIPEQEMCSYTPCTSKPIVLKHECVRDPLATCQSDGVPHASGGR